MVLLEQIRTIDKQRLKNAWVPLTTIYEQGDNAIAVSFGLNQERKYSAHLCAILYIDKKANGSFTMLKKFVLSAVTVVLMAATLFGVDRNGRRRGH